MYRDHRIAVVVPAYNEAAFVGEVLETVPSYVDRVYAVDDCSTDGTWAEIRRRAATEAVVVGTAASDPGSTSDEPALDSRSLDRVRSDGGGGSVDVGGADSVGGGPTGTDPASRTGSIEPVTEGTTIGDAGPRESLGESAGSSGGEGDAGAPTVVPIRHAENRGVGAAITTGYRRALADGIDVTAVMAGDGQMDPAQLSRLLDPIVEGRAAYAKGNRLRGREQFDSMSRFRFGGNVLLSLLTKVASGYWGMLDPQNGYTAISREALAGIDLDSLYTEYGFANDLLVELNTNGFSIADVAMPAVYGDERSHIAYRTFVPRLSWLLWRRFLHRLGVNYVLRDFHPLVGLYALGIGGLAVGLGSIAGYLLGSRSGASASTATDAHDTTSQRSGGRSETDDTRRSIRWWLAGTWAFIAAIALCLAMTFDHDSNDGTVVVVDE